MVDITWIKLKTDMFENDKIKLIEALPDADTIIVIWVKLLAAAGKANINGYIMLTENIAMNEEEMATIFNRPLNTVRLALQTFKRYGMIEVDNDAFRIKNWENHQNIDGMDKVRLQNAERKRKQRARQKQLELSTKTDSHVMSRDSHATERETDLDKDIDKELDKETDNKKEKEVGPSVIYSFYESNIGPLKPFIGEEIGCEIDEHGAELVLEALKESVTANARNKVKYAQGILRNWNNEGLNSLHDLEMKRNRGESNGNLHARSNGQSAIQNGNDPFAGYSSN
ncbi:phage replisome organizer N-terminal domain-containing protein [Viridibacillus arvi]|uniref:phage replisome organizer N-terminal domain-containing protein n=1 Tax=Viridibacillus arvi TaxID=263475 RepID=UPI0036AFCAC4